MPIVQAALEISSLPVLPLNHVGAPARGVLQSWESGQGWVLEGHLRSFHTQVLRVIWVPRKI